MNNLLKLQQQFQNAILGEKSNFIEFVAPIDGLTKEERVNIYANGYVIRLVEAIVANYPGLSQYMGDNLFDLMARAYIQKYPSTFRCIRDFGDKLALFLEEQKSYKPSLIEFARFEWAVGETFDALDCGVLNIEELKNVESNNWPNLRFRFHKAIHYEVFYYNTASIWESLINNKIKRSIKLSSPQKILFWRYNQRTHYLKLSKIEAYVLEQALEGQKFAIICEGLCDFVSETDASAEIVKILVKWLSRGIIQEIY